MKVRSKTDLLHLAKPNPLSVSTSPSGRTIEPREESANEQTQEHTNRLHRIP